MRPFKKTQAESKRNHSIEDVYQKINALENDMKRINTLEVYLKQVIQMEKRLNFMQISDKQAKELEKEKHLSAITHVEKKLLLFVQKTIKKQIEPIHHSVEQLSEQLAKLERRISTLEKLYNENMEMYDAVIKETSTNTGKEQSVIYQEFKVDKLFVDHYEQVNNLGNLGIKELNGHLNIGTTYEKYNNPVEFPQKAKAEHKQLKEIIEKQKDYQNDEKIQNEAEQRDKT